MISFTSFSSQRRSKSSTVMIHLKSKKKSCFINTLSKSKKTVLVSTISSTNNMQKAKSYLLLSLPLLPKKKRQKHNTFSTLKTDHYLRPFSANHQQLSSGRVKHLHFVQHVVLQHFDYNWLIQA